MEKILREIIRETIRKVGKKYVVYPKRNGKRLGTHSTRSAAEKQLQAIHIQQHIEGKGGSDTSWTDGNETITLQDILDLTKNIKVVNYPTRKLAKIVLNWNDNPEEIERINQVTVSNQYPILIMVDENKKIKWILDGNHRAQKALRSKAKTIPAKLIKPSNLDIKSKKILLGITEIKKQLQAIHIQQHTEMLNYPNWLRNKAQVPQNNPDGEHRYFLPKKKIKEFAMGMMSPVEKAKHQRNMHRLMKILNKHQVQYFEYPDIPNTLVRKLYEAMDKIPGGLSQGKGLTDLVRKMDPKGYQYNSQLLDLLKKELELGIKTEMEHTSDPKIAKEIALDHLFEDPKYYTKLKKTGL